MKKDSPKRFTPVGHPDRDTAAQWAELYRQAMAEPDGIYCVKDEDGFNLIYLDASNPEYLVGILENFARFGTFENRKTQTRLAAEKFLLQANYREKLKQGLTQDEALEQIADENKTKRGYSRSSIERKLGLRR